MDFLDNLDLTTFPGQGFFTWMDFIDAFWILDHSESKEVEYF